jgi:hypothetical protein
MASATPPPPAAGQRIEGAIDFPDQDLELDHASALDRGLGELRGACARLAYGFGHGRAGIAVALVGR